MESQSIPCPFVYANGRHCCGVVYRVRAYGPHRGKSYIDPSDVRKFRLSCSDKDDHAGAVSSWASKNRMEFYPDELVRLGIYDQAVLACEDIVVEDAADEPSYERMPLSEFDYRSPEQKAAEALNEAVKRLWPEKWLATCSMSRTASVKHRKRLRAQAAEINRKNEHNARLAPVA